MRMRRILELLTFISASSILFLNKKHSSENIILSKINFFLARIILLVINNQCEQY